jgi:hypothetical protein
MRMATSILRCGMLILAVTALPRPARGQEAPSTIPPSSEPPPAVESAPAASEPDSTEHAPVANSTQKPFRYSVPWQLRPLPAPTVLRLDNVVAFNEDKQARHGLTTVSFLTAAGRIPGTGPARAGLDVLARAGFAVDSPPTGDGGWALVNALVGAAYAVRLPSDFLLNAFLGFTLPIGNGGGDTPDKEKLAARTRATAARSQLDNPILGTNDFGVIPGIGVGWVSHGWTLQLEATLSHVVRVRGEQAQREKTKTNSAFGLHVGYFILPVVSLNTELRYQHWLNPPFSVDADPTGASVDNLSFALGPRFHIDTGVGWIRPGIAYARGLDRPMAAASPNLHIVQIDIPFFF